MVTESDAELISAWIDGELDPALASSLLDRVASEPGVAACWARYHLVQDALHSHEVAAMAVASCEARVAAALRDEPAHGGHVVNLPARSRPRSRRLVQGLAIAAGIAGIAWVAVPLFRDASGDAAPHGAVVAAARSMAAPGRPARLDVADASGEGLDSYIAAHGDLAGNGFMPPAAALLRASFAEEK